MLRASAIFSLLLLAACASSTEVQKSERWTPYPGCGPTQCQTWLEECTSECINEQVTSVTECESKCRNRVPDCQAGCPE